MQNQRKWLRVSFVLYAVLILIMAFVTARRAHKGSNDFDTYYYAGRSVLAGQSLYYAPDAEYEYADPFQDKGPFLYPPFAAVFFAPFALFPIKVAGFLWALCSGVLFFMTVLLSLRLLSRGRHLPRFITGPPQAVIGGGVITVWLLILLLDNLAMAQINITVLFFVVAALYRWRQERPFRAGILLSVAILLKVTPVLFAVYFLFRRQWKLLAGVIFGAAFFTLIVPTIFSGWQSNYLMHRQWAGRTLEPMAPHLFEKRNADAVRYFDSHEERLRHHRLVGQMTRKNQALEAAMMRLFLKDRQRLAYDYTYPVYPVRAYLEMPVLIGFSREALEVAVRVLQLVIGVSLLVLWMRKTTSPERRREKIWLDICLVFVVMTILPPWVRSHQFIFWLFPLIYAWTLLQMDLLKKSPGRQTAGLMFLAFLFYLAQAAPYGKAAGLGALSALLLYAAYGLLAVRLPFEEKVQG